MVTAGVLGAVVVVAYSVVAAYCLLTSLRLRPVERPDDWGTLSLLWPVWLVAALTAGVAKRTVWANRFVEPGGERFW